MKYYLHDSSSFQYEEITELYIKFGYEGLGLFYTLLEKIALQEKPVKTMVLKRQLNVGKRLEKCWKFMEEIGIISSNNGETFSEQLLNYIGTYKIKKEKNRERISQWRENQSVKENVMCNESVRNAGKVKRSKVNEIKLKEIIKEDGEEKSPQCIEILDAYDFEILWELYDKKIGNKEKLKKKWDKLSQTEKEDVFIYIPEYKKSQPDKKYRKNLETFLNNKSWNDEIIKNQQQADDKFNEVLRKLKDEPIESTPGTGLDVPYDLSKYNRS